MELTEAFILGEIAKLQRIYELKQEIRYGESRTDATNPESVAEHVFGMHVLFEYFWPLEDPGKKWDQAKMRQMITFHDVDEIITGDKIGYLKTAADKAAEAHAHQQVMEEIPATLKNSIATVLSEYEERETVEAKFIKAIDKIEPVFHVFNPAGKELLHRMRTTREQHDSIKLPYFQPFPVIKRFYDVSIAKMVNDGYFVG